jgi:hypothetical protein
MFANPLHVLSNLSGLEFARCCTADEKTPSNGTLATIIFKKNLLMKKVEH